MVSKRNYLVVLNICDAFVEISLAGWHDGFKKEFLYCTEFNKSNSVFLQRLPLYLDYLETDFNQISDGC